MNEGITGKFSHIQSTNHAYTEEEIKQYYAETELDNPNSYDEILIDHSSNENNGIVYGPTPTVEGITGKALPIHYNDYVNLPEEYRKQHDRIGELMSKENDCPLDYDSISGLIMDTADEKE